MYNKHNGDFSKAVKSDQFVHPVDRQAAAHDIRYLLAGDEPDKDKKYQMIRAADEKFISRLKKMKQDGNVLLPLKAMQAKVLFEKAGGKQYSGVEPFKNDEQRRRANALLAALEQVGEGGSTERILNSSGIDWALVGSAAIKHWADEMKIDNDLKPSDEDYMVDARGNDFQNLVKDYFDVQVTKRKKPIYENIVGSDDLFQRLSMVDMSDKTGKYLNPKQLLKIYSSIDEFDQKPGHQDKIELLKEIIKQGGKGKVFSRLKKKKEEVKNPRMSPTLSEGLSPNLSRSVSPSNVDFSIKDEEKVEYNKLVDDIVANNDDNKSNDEELMKINALYNRVIKDRKQRSVSPKAKFTVKQSKDDKARLSRASNKVFGKTDISGNVSKGNGKKKKKFDALINAIQGSGLYLTEAHPSDKVGNGKEE